MPVVFWEDFIVFFHNLTLRYTVPEIYSIDVSNYMQNGMAGVYQITYKDRPTTYYTKQMDLGCVSMLHVGDVLHRM